MFNFYFWNFFYEKVVLLFLTRSGLVIIWKLPMYYKSFRSRVIFEKILWSNKELNQKKFINNYSLNIIYLKTKKNLNKIDINNEFLFIDNNMKNEFFENKIDLEFFKNFKGCIFLYDFLYIKTIDDKKYNEYNTLIFFYNVLTSKVLCYSLASKFERLVIQNIIKLYLEDDSNIIELNDIEFLLDNFVEQINNEEKFFIDKDECGFFHYNYDNKKSFLLFLKNW